MNRQNQRQAQPQAGPPDFLTQLANFGRSIGLYARFAITLNVLIFICQKIFMSDSMEVALVYGFNYQSIVSAHQYYRFVTAAFSHQGVAHILFNMCALAVFSTSLEKTYGTLFFAMVNIWILILCSSIQLLYAHARIFWLPESFGGSTAQLVTYSYGYSAILFGLIMLLSLTGDRYIVVYGCKLCKIALPFIYLVVSQMIVGNADLFGHLSGIIAALILRYCGLYQLRLLPQQSWLQTAEMSPSERTVHWRSMLGYFCATEAIENEFCYCKSSLRQLLRERRQRRLASNSSGPQMVGTDSLSDSINETNSSSRGRFELRKMPITDSNEEKA